MNRLAFIALVATVYACGELPPEVTPGPGDVDAQPTEPTTDVYDFDCQDGAEDGEIRTGVYFDPAATVIAERDQPQAGRTFIAKYFPQRDAETGEYVVWCIGTFVRLEVTK